MLSEKDARRAVYNIWKDMETLWLFVFENEDAAARFSLLDAWNCTNPEIEARYVRSFWKIMEGEKKIRSWYISYRDNKLLLDAIAHCQFLPVDILNDIFRTQSTAFLYGIVAYNPNRTIRYLTSLEIEQRKKKSW